MRGIFSILSLLVVVAIVGVLVKKQLSPVPVKVAPADGALVLPALASGATPRQQSQQIQQQLRESLDNSLQQARPMPDDH